MPAAATRARRTPPPPEWFWEPVDPAVQGAGRPPLDLPVLESQVVRTEGAAKLWDELPPDARERLRKDGVLVLGAGPGADPGDTLRGRSMGAFYTDLRTDRVPHLITIDALVSLVHLGIERALSDVDENVVGPELLGFLEKLDARLGKEEGGATAELAGGYRIARSLVAVARALASPAYVVPAELAPVVTAERGSIEGHAAAAMSPLLGVTLDYARFNPPSASGHPGSWRALAWLAAAPLALVARSEVPGGPVDVGRARTNARAAMLLARVCDRDVDASIFAAYAHLVRILGFVWGSADDLSLIELDDVATAGGVDVTKPEMIANVVTVDRVRARARAGRAPALFDGSAATGPAGVSVRLFGGHASPDSIALQALVGTPVGGAQEAATSDRSGAKSREDERIDRVRAGRRILPATLDIAAWLGVPDARAALRESRADAFDGYDVALANQQRVRPGEGSALHASVHGTFLDVLIAWANAERAPGGTPRGLARVESILAGWTLLRHTSTPLGRPAPPPAVPPGDLRVSGAALPIFVEPFPDVVARLVALVRQLRRGLESVGPLPPTSGASATLVEIEDILKIALRATERQANEEAGSSEELSALASLPARFLRLEETTRGDVGPVIAVVYSDPASHRLLASATGRIEPVLTFAREPGKEEAILVVGAHLAHHEIVEGFERAPGVLHAVRPPLTDLSWRARLKADLAKPGGGVRSALRAPWVDAFRISGGGAPGKKPGAPKP